MDGSEHPEIIAGELGASAGAYRDVAYGLRRWASGDEHAANEDFVSLRLVAVQAIALTVFVAFAGMGLATSPADRLGLIGTWLMLLAPIAGFAWFIRNFAVKRAK